jgi:hypothetical protein
VIGEGSDNRRNTNGWGSNWESIVILIDQGKGAPIFADSGVIGRYFRQRSKPIVVVVSRWAVLV